MAPAAPMSPTSFLGKRAGPIDLPYEAPPAYVDADPSLISSAGSTSSECSLKFQPQKSQYHAHHMHPHHMHPMVPPPPINQYTPPENLGYVWVPSINKFMNAISQPPQQQPQQPPQQMQYQQDYFQMLPHSPPLESPLPPPPTQQQQQQQHPYQYQGDFHEKRRKFDISVAPYTPQSPPFTSANLPPPVFTPRPEYFLKKHKPPNIVLPKMVDNDTDFKDDEDGHFHIVPNASFTSRYQIVKLLGQGTFGKVAMAYDTWTQQYCAIKIIRAIPKYRDASKIELRVLSLLRTLDPQNVGKCLRMQECFDFRNHVCIVSDLLDMSVYDFLKWNRYQPFPVSHVKRFAKQLLTSVAFIHSIGIVHTDLKPENMLLLSSKVLATNKENETSASSTKRNLGSRRTLKSTEMTLIDFGSAVFDDEYHSAVVSTRHYRAPEIIFGTGWSYPCDLWSVGCVLVELVTGKVLFETRDNLEHLHLMEKALSKHFSVQQLAQALNTTEGRKLVTKFGFLPGLNPLVASSQVDNVDRMRTYREMVAEYAELDDSWPLFFDLIDKLTALDPNLRITAQDALRHPWVSM